MKKLSSYLTAGIATTATFQSSDAATVVTFYGSGARNPSTSPATPLGISMGVYGIVNRALYAGLKNKSIFRRDSGNYFSAGSDLAGTYIGVNAVYSNIKGIFAYGAQSGSANYVNISFDGDNVYEAVGQFNLDGLGTGYLVALAINDSPASALSISAGKAAIDAVPEPSAIALLALGAGGMAMRRRRKVA